MRAFKHFVGVLIAAILAAACTVAGGSAARLAGRAAISETGARPRGAVRILPVLANA